MWWPITYVVWFWLMRRYPAAGLSSFAFLTPVFGVLCGGLLLDEPLTIRIFLALALIGAGLIIVNRPQRKALKPMRDILGDLEAGRQLSDPDPVRRAQNQMKTPRREALLRRASRSSAKPRAFRCAWTASR